MKKFLLPDLSGCLDRFLDDINLKAGEKVMKACGAFGKIGLASLSVLAVLSVIAAVVLAVRFEAGVGAAVIFAVTGVAGCALLHYTGAKMLPTLNTLIKNAPTKMSSAVVLKVLALFVGVSGVLVLLGGIFYKSTFLAEQPDSPDAVVVFLSSLAAFVACEVWSFLLLRPADLNVEIVEKTTVGEEFIGLTSYFAKGCLKLTPVVFGLAAVFAVLTAVAMIFTADFGLVFAQMIVLSYMAFMTLAPFVMYIAFLSYYLTLDILTAVLKLPEKLDKIAEK